MTAHTVTVDASELLEELAGKRLDRALELAGHGEFLVDVHAEWLDEIRTYHRKRLARLLDAVERRATGDAERDTVALVRETFAAGLPTPFTELVGLVRNSGPQDPSPSREPSVDAQANGGLVGRTAEMSRLRRAFAETSNGAGRVAMVTGEAGIGKTRLTEAFTEWATTGGATVLWGRCSEAEGVPAFWPWLQVLRTLAAEAQTTPTSRAEATAVLDQLLPAQDAPRRPDTAGDPLARRFLFFESIRSLFNDAAEVAPLVLVLEDLHWADGSSLLLLEHLATGLATTPLLVIATFREGQLRRGRPLTRTAALLVRLPATTRFRLVGLRREDARHLVGRLAGTKQDSAVVDVIHDLTEGHPFFLREVVLLLSSLCPDEPWSRSDLERLGVPDGIRATVDRRLEHLDVVTRRVLDAASVVGREFSYDVVRETTRLSADEVLIALDEAQRSEFVSRAPNGMVRYRFAHVLVRETLYTALGDVDRRRLHADVADALERIHGDDLTGVLSELAEHSYLALPIGSPPKASRYASLAASQAQDRLAYEELVFHRRRALEAYELTLPRSTGEQVDLLLALGDAQDMAGHVEAAAACLSQAARRSRAAGGGEQLARAVLAFSGVPYETGTVDHSLIGLVSEALEALGNYNASLRARLLARCAVALTYAPGSWPERQDLLREALLLARNGNDRLALVGVLAAQHWALWSPDTLEKRIAVADECVELALAIGNRERELLARQSRIADRLEAGHLARATREIEQYQTLTDDLGLPTYRWEAALLSAMQALLAGHLGEAEKCIASAHDLGLRVGEPDAEQTSVAQRLSLAEARGSTRELTSRVRVLAYRYPAISAWSALDALAAARDGDSEYARDRVAKLAVDAFEQIPRDMHWLVTMTALAEVSVLVEDLDAADLLYTLLAPFAGRLVIFGWGWACRGTVSSTLSLLASHTHRPRDAQAHATAALAELKGIDAPLLRQCGELLLGTGHRAGP